MTLNFNNDIDGCVALKILQLVEQLEGDTTVEVEYNWVNTSQEAESDVMEGFVDDIVVEMKESAWYFWSI